MASKFQKKTIDKLKANGWKVLKIIRLNENGFPDIIALKNGTTIFVECKEKTDSLSVLQECRLTELRNLGFYAFIEQDGRNSHLDSYLESF